MDAKPRERARRADVDVVRAVVVRADRRRPYRPPHANTPATRALVKKTLIAKGIKVLADGEIKGEQIDKDQLIDQHYYAIASKVSASTID